MMRSGNPVLNDKTFTRHIDGTDEEGRKRRGRGNKSGAIRVLLLLTGAVSNGTRSEEHNSELQSREPTSYAVFGWKKKKKKTNHQPTTRTPK